MGEGRNLTWGVLAALLAGAAIVPASAAQGAGDALERGRYLMETVGGGARFSQDGVAFGAAPNITPDRETGIGRWSDAGIIRAIREGVRPDGSYLGPVMAFDMYRRISDGDMHAIVAYLRSMPPVRNMVPRTAWRTPRRTPYGPPAGHVPDPPRTDRVTYGAYLAGPLAECVACHTPYGSDGRPDYAHRLGAGGTSFETPRGEAIAGNITPDRDTGLGDFTVTQIKSMIVSGVRPNYSRANPVMPHRRFAGLAPEDLDAIVAYLRALKPVRNMIDK
jgi:cytochrome c553